MIERYEDWTSHDCVEGGTADDHYGSGSAGDFDTIDSPFLAPTGATDAQIADAITLASDILFYRTGRLLQGYSPPREYRPCRRFPNGWPAWWPFRFMSTVAPQWAWVSGSPSIGWMGWGVCTCQDHCTCQPVDRIQLGVYPLVPDTVTVTIDGVAFTDFVVEDHLWLVRLDGEPWPMCQDVYAAATEPDTFQAIAQHGAPITPGAQVAACLLARHIALAMAASSDCQLGDDVVTVVRQGTTQQRTSPAELLAASATGLPLVDAWVDAFNGGRKPTRPTTFIVPGSNAGRPAARAGAWLPRP